jgi:alpha-beta hydrolase superfamily lysophospholipase
MLARISLLIGATMLTVLNASGAENTPTQDLTLKAADGVTVYGTFYRAEHPKAIILLFHQAGSNSGEYAPIAPRLVQEGYSAVAIDQRSGSGMFGHVNQTQKGFGREATYLDAEPDLEAALSFAATQHLPIAVWGSSYSSALVFLLAAKHPAEIKAVLSFSPGEYLGTPDMVRSAAAKVDLPIYVTSAKEKEEVDAAKTILAASPSKMKTQFIPQIAGVHGSSTLRSERNPKGMAENWKAVLAFLGSVFK